MEAENKSTWTRAKKYKRSKEQKQRDILFCSELFLRGYTYRNIADQCNDMVKAAGDDYKITHVQVYDDMQQCLVEWKKERFDNIDQYITQELQKLDRMEAEAWEQFERSKNGKSKTKARTDRKSIRPIVDDEDEEKTKYGFDEKTEEDTLGDPRYLDILLKVQQRRAKLLGYDAPIKFQDTTPQREGDLSDKYNISVLPADMLFAIVDKLQDAKFQFDKTKDAA